jgi:hypothetical protein
MAAAFAPVASLEMYRRLLEAGELGDYQLLIASEVLKDTRGWDDFWKTEVGQDSFIIMDNGLIETGKPLAPLDLFRAAETVGADCIVVPDKLGDYKATLRLGQNHIPELQGGPFPLLGVLQGTEYNEVLDLAEFYRDAGVQYISVPRIMVELFGSRIELVHMVAQKWGPVPAPFIHLLGFSDRIEDDMIAATQHAVMGIDSAVPIWLGLANGEYLPGRPPIHIDLGKRPKDYWSLKPDPHSVNIDIVLANIRKVRAWLTQYAAKAVPAAQATE